jgi:hypothetical protein
VNNLYQGLSRHIDPLDLSAVEVIGKKAFADTTVRIFADPARAGSIARTGLEKLAFQFVRLGGRRHSLSFIRLRVNCVPAKPARRRAPEESNNYTIVIAFPELGKTYSSRGDGLSPSGRGTTGKIASSSFHSYASIPSRRYLTDPWAKVTTEIAGKKMIRVPYDQGVGETFAREPESP